MKDKEIQNLMDFFLEPDIDDEEVINEFIEKSGIDMERLNERVFDLLKRYQLEDKIEHGKQFKEFYLEATSKMDQKNSNTEREAPRLAARKQSDDFTKEEQNDILSDEEKLKMIKKFKDDTSGQG